MANLKDANASEPLYSSATVVALVGAIIALVTSFGLSLDTTQTAAILGLTTVLSPFIVAAINRSRVTANKNVALTVDEAEALEATKPKIAYGAVASTATLDPEAVRVALEKSLEQRGLRDYPGV